MGMVLAGEPRAVQCWEMARHGKRLRGTGGGSAHGWVQLEQQCSKGKHPKEQQHPKKAAPMAAAAEERASSSGTFSALQPCCSCALSVLS